MQLPAIIEALLLASESPLGVEEIARLVRSRVAEAEDVHARENEDGNTPAPIPDWLVALSSTSAEDVVAAITALNAEYQQTGRAFAILERAKGWKLYTRPEFGEFVRQMFPGRKPERLSGPAMETLAIIAYRQPITKAAIEAVRGVSCDGMVQKLLDRDLIRIGGRAELPGRPLLYETTELFFEHFGIRTIDDLPNASELRRVKLPEAPAENPEPTGEASVDDAEQQLALVATPETDADAVAPTPEHPSAS
ncbi:MAG: SMC-Scp complex subunit ScpB [Luteolibacter sp.]